MDVFLGIDLGTTNCKVLAVDLQGQPVASASAPTPARTAAGQDTPEYDAENALAGLRRSGAPLDGAVGRKAGR